MPASTSPVYNGQTAEPETTPIVEGGASVPGAAAPSGRYRA